MLRAPVLYAAPCLLTVRSSRAQHTTSRPRQSTLEPQFHAPPLALQGPFCARRMAASRDAPASAARRWMCLKAPRGWFVMVTLCALRGSSVSAVSCPTLRSTWAPLRASQGRCTRVPAASAFLPLPFHCGLATVVFSPSPASTGPFAAAVCSWIRLVPVLPLPGAFVPRVEPWRAKGRAALPVHGSDACVSRHHLSVIGR